jgi:hypothetical protein
MYNDPMVQIKDIRKMSRHIGRDVAHNMDIPLDEFRTYIKPKEVRSLIRQYCVEKNGEYLINAMILQKIFKEINDWVLGIKLCKMASSGDLAASWDEDKNCMVFGNLKEI